MFGREEGINFFFFFRHCSLEKQSSRHINVRLPAIIESLIRCGYLLGNGGFPPEPLVTGLSICDPFMDKCVLTDVVVIICMVY